MTEAARRGAPASRAAVLAATALLVAGPLLSTAAPVAALDPVPDSPASRTEPNDVSSVLPRTPAPIDLQPSGGGFVASGPTRVRTDPAPVGKPTALTEVIDLRTEHSKVVQNPDGTFTKSISLGRMNYRDASGAWQPIDIRLINEAKDGYERRMAANDISVRTAGEVGAERIVELATGGFALRLRVPGLAGGTVAASADLLSFSGLGSDPGFEIRPTPEGFEFRATIASPRVKPEVRVAVEAVGVVPTMDRAGTMSRSHRDDPSVRDPLIIP